jgi:phosphoribosylaminoimidazolecarboxamide formyltransferase/IMP cyclohydrolase
MLFKSHDDPLGLDKFEVVAGEPMDCNDYQDLNRLLRTMTQIAATFDINRGYVPQIAIAAKHGNICGAGIELHHHRNAIRKVTGDLGALFGGLIMVNFPIEMDEAKLMLTFKSENQLRLLGGIIAPSFSTDAIEILKSMGGHCRFIANQKLFDVNRDSLDKSPVFQHVRGGFLLQPNYTHIFDLEDQSLKKYGEASKNDQDDLLLAKAICDTSDYCAVTIVSSGQLIGNGVGQKSSVDSVKLAIEIAMKHYHSLAGAVTASNNSFFSNEDPALLIERGIKVIISRNGSARDDEIVELCQKAGVSLYLISD